jgi:ubiquinone/menaquinone biosynthesis C-methylase UbiE
MFAPFVADLVDCARPQPGEHVLDLACGTGVVARRIAPLVVPGGSIEGLDLSDQMLVVARDAARREGAACAFSQGNMERLPYETGAYDLVTCQQGLQFVGDRAAAVSEMRRVLRHGGRAVVSCWSAIEHHPLSLAIAPLIERATGQPHMDVPFSLSRVEELRVLFAAAGFLEIAIQTVTRPVRFPDPDRYVTMSVNGMIAANPDLRQMAADEREALIAPLRAEMEPALREFIIGQEVVSTKQTRIVRAHA